MTDDELRARIVSTPGVLAGKPRIRETRLAVRLILSHLAHGATCEEIIGEYPRLTSDDIRACLLYAADMLDNKRSDELFDSDAFVTVTDWSNRESQDA